MESNEITLRERGQGDKLLEELIQTETEMTQQTLRLLRTRYEKEKEQWTKLLCPS